jgi:proline racemase
MTEKMRYMSENEDWLRKFVTFEPRGGKSAAATLITTPCSPNADVGILYFEPNGWLPMCGQGTIGAGVMLVEMGMVKVSEPYTTVKLDTPAGIVDLKIKIKDGRVLDVSFINVPSFVIVAGEKIRTGKYGTVSFDISYGGNFYAIIPAESVGIDIDPDNYNLLIEAADFIKPLINEHFPVVHPENGLINGVSHIQFTGPPKNPSAYSQNAVVCSPGGIDRSPCGTGTSARCALLCQQGKIRLGEPFVYESIIGSLFSCKAVERTNVGPYEAVVPEITGKSYVIGMSSLMLDPDDPFQSGFLLG